MKNTPQPKRQLLRARDPKIIVAAVLILLLLAVLVYGIATGNKGGNTTGLIDNLGRAQEISRVTTEQSQNLKDPAVASVAATTQAALSSEQSQIKALLVKNKVKVDKNKLALYQNKNTDSLLSTAAQNNSLDSAYLTYLRGALNDYAQSLKSTYAATPSAAVKAILQDAFDSTQTLLNSAPLKS